MEHAFDEGLIGFSEKGDFPKLDDCVNIYGEMFSMMPIQYCPFCNRKIKTKLITDVDNIENNIIDIELK